MSKHTGFTLIELLVVVAIIALLIVILMPALRDAREQGKQVACLANMRSIGQATHAYAYEDKFEHAVPIHQTMVHTTQGGAESDWLWRTMLPRTFGGRTPIRGFPLSGGGQWPGTSNPDGWWAAQTRPLNNYLYGNRDAMDESGLTVFRCPSDRGYPDHPTIVDAPPVAVGIPLYDYLGNSYRIQTTGMYWPGGGGQHRASFTVGPWGHRLSTLQDTGKLVIYTEPCFYNFARRCSPFDPDTHRLRGWHRQVMAENVTFTDGSARSTRVGALQKWDHDTLARMGVRATVGINLILRRTSTWRMDCYPTPGAFIPVQDGNGGWLIDRLPANYIGWPFDGHQLNIFLPD